VGVYGGSVWGGCYATSDRSRNYNSRLTGKGKEALGQWCRKIWADGELFQHSSESEKGQRSWHWPCCGGGKVVWADGGHKV